MSIFTHFDKDGETLTVYDDETGEVTRLPMKRQSFPLVSPAPLRPPADPVVRRFKEINKTPKKDTVRGGGTTKCGTCGEPGHNKKTCTKARDGAAVLTGAGAITQYRCNKGHTFGKRTSEIENVEDDVECPMPACGASAYTV